MKKRPHLIVLNQMAGPLTWEMVEDLAGQGDSVAMLTGHPDTLKKGSQPNLSVSRSFEYRRGSLLRRSISWLCYLVHAFFWLWRWPRDIPLLVFSNPPMLVWLAALMRKIRGTPFVVMVHDVYPDLPIRMGRLDEQSWVARNWRSINRRSYRAANAVLTLGDHMREVLQANFENGVRSRGESEPKVHVIRPWADTDQIQPISKESNKFAIEHRQNGKLTVMYSGNMGLGHDIETMLAASRLTNHSSVHFLFIGAGPKWTMLDRELGSRPQDNVTLLPWQDESLIPLSLATADIAMVSLEPEVAGLAIPSKAFYSLAAGTPLLVLADQATELADIVSQFDCGWLVQPGDAAKLAAIVDEMARDSGKLVRLQKNARAASEQIGSRKKNSQEFINLLKDRSLES